MSDGATTQKMGASERTRDTSIVSNNLISTLIEGKYWAYLLLVPSLILVLAVVVYPVISGIWLSFHEYRLNRPALGRPFIGLDQYRDMLDDKTIRIALKNTLIWVTVGSISQFILGLITALALHRGLRGFRIAAVLVLIPWLLPSVVSANMWRLMLDSRLGVVNEILSSVGLVERGHAWFTNPNTALYEVLAVELWKNFAFFTLFFLAGLYAIPSEYYEASSVDGSGTVQRFRDITIPMLMPVIVGATILRVIGLFNSPDILLVLTGGGPGNATQTLALYGFQTAYLRFDFGYAAALSVLAMFCLMAFTVVYVRASGVTKE